MPLETGQSHILFSFGYHTQEEVALVPLVEAQLRGFYSQHTHGRNIFFEEGLGASVNSRNNLAKAIRRGRTFIDTITEEVYLRDLGLKPGQYSLIDARQKILNPRPSGRLRIATYQMLDEVAQDVKFEYDCEAMPAAEATKAKHSFDETIQMRTDVLDVLSVGNIPGAMAMYLQKLRLGNNNQRLRDRNVTDQVVDLVKQTPRIGQPINLFIRFGERHDPLPDMVAHKLRGSQRIPKPDIDVQYDFGRPLTLFSDELDTRLRNNPRASFSEEELMKGWLCEFLDFYLELGKVPRPERVSKANLVAVASLEDIEETLSRMDRNRRDDPNLDPILEDFLARHSS